MSKVSKQAKDAELRLLTTKKKQLEKHPFIVLKQININLAIREYTTTRMHAQKAGRRPLKIAANEVTIHRPRLKQCYMERRR